MEQKKELEELAKKVDNIEKMVIQMHERQLDTKVKPDDKMFTADEAAVYLKMSINTLYQHTSSKNIEFFRRPGTRRLFFAKEILDAWRRCVDS